LNEVIAKSAFLSKTYIAMVYNMQLCKQEAPKKAALCKRSDYQIKADIYV